MGKPVWFSCSVIFFVLERNPFFSVLLCSFVDEGLGVFRTVAGLLGFVSFCSLRLFFKLTNTLN